MFHNSSKHITERLIRSTAAILFRRECMQIHYSWKSVCTGPPLLKTCRLRPHCARMYPSSMRRTAITKTFTALWKNTVQASHNLSTHAAVCLYFCLKGKDSSNGTFVQPERYLKEVVYVFKRGGDHRLPNIRTMLMLMLIGENVLCDLDYLMYCTVNYSEVSCLMS